MDAALAGLIGTGVGATIGGTVTVLSLWIKGKQDASARIAGAARDDEVRAQDRAWAVRQQNLDQRRDLYSRLLRTAYVVSGRADRLALSAQPIGRAEVEDALQIKLPSAGDDEQAPADGLLETMTIYEVLASETQVTAVNKEVIRCTLRIREQSKALITLFLLAAHNDEDTVRRSAKELADGIKSSYGSLIEVCRRDLGYDDSTDDT